MAMNPMQRKVRNSFLLGLLVAIIIGAIVAGVLFMNIKGLKDELNKMKKDKEIATTTVYALSEGAKENQTLVGNEDGDDAIITPIKLDSKLVPENALTDERILEYQNDEDNLELVAKIDMEAGTILTTDMVEKKAETESFRLIEYRDITLPTKLEAGDYIDIRMKDSSGVSFIVLSKVKVEEATASSIWLKLSESKMLILNNAIVESYIMEGTLLYATQYINSAQRELATTYIPNAMVIEFMKANQMTEEDKRLIDEAEEDFKSRDANQGENGIRHYINDILERIYSDEEIRSSVAEGYLTEKTATQAAREELLGEIGY